MSDSSASPAPRRLSLKARQSTPASTQWPVFLPCPRGLEGELARECAELGVATAPASGGVQGKADLQAVVRLNLWSRLASRVLIQIGEARVRSADDLLRQAQRQPWHEWFSARRSLRLDADVRGRDDWNAQFVLLKTKDGLCDAFRQRGGRRPNIDKRQPQVRVRVHVDGQRAHYLIDTSGESLFKRGYRLQGAVAPLRENLAAGLLRLAGYDGRQALVDPMCGSGTLLIEAAEMALQRAPGRRRDFAMRCLSPFADLALEERYAEAQAAGLSEAPCLLGGDLDPAILRQAERNLRQAQLQDMVTLQQGDARKLRAPASSGLLVCNPPYGLRLEEQESLQRLYPLLGSWLKQSFAGWDSWWLSADRTLPQGMGLAAKSKIPLRNGDIDVRFFHIPLVAGKFRQGESA